MNLTKFEAYIKSLKAHDTYPLDRVPNSTYPGVYINTRTQILYEGFEMNEARLERAELKELDNE